MIPDPVDHDHHDRRRSELDWLISMALVRGILLGISLFRRSELG